MKMVLKTVSMVAILVGALGTVGAQNSPPPYTVISVEKMHCEGCAKRIGGKLQTVAGVKGIQYDVQKKLLWVHPQEGRQPSPRSLWEAVETANDRPTLMQGPSGRFNAKPSM